MQERQPDGCTCPYIIASGVIVGTTLHNTQACFFSGFTDFFPHTFNMWFCLSLNVYIYMHVCIMHVNMHIVNYSANPIMLLTSTAETLVLLCSPEESRNARAN